MVMLYLPSGTPTAELFAASYNNTGKSNTITLELGTYGYTENTSNNWLRPEDNHGIYNKDSSINWWLASPNDGSSVGLFVNGNGYFGSSGVDYYSGAVRPLVCIPTSIFNNKYATDTTLVNQ